jgi:hypothetical protein
LLLANAMWKEMWKGPLASDEAEGLFYFGWTRWYEDGAN